MMVRRVLLDGDFIDAVADINSANHTDATALYLTLVDGYTAGNELLFALSSTLARVPKSVQRTTFAPVCTVWVARQHRSAARRVRAEVSANAALTLVMLDTENIRTIATLSAEFAGFDLQLLTSAHRPAADS